MEGLHELPRVTTDHILIGFSSQDMGYRGFVSAPLVSDVIDEPMFSKVTSIGLKEADARHFVNAVHEECGIFLTTDPDFHDIRESLQALYPSIRIFTPIQLREFIAALQG